MEYQNYLIAFKQVDSNLFVKFTNKKSYESYQNIITPEQIDNFLLTIYIFLRYFFKSILFLTKISFDIIIGILFLYQSFFIGRRYSIE